MRYFFEGGTLFLRGSFTAASTGPDGGLARVSTIICRTVPPGWDPAGAEREVETIAARAGYSCDAFGMFTPAPVQNLCVLQYDFVTCFVTARMPPEDEAGNVSSGAVSVIIYSGEGLAAGSLLSAIVTATEATAETLRSLGFTAAGTPGDGVIICSEGPVEHLQAGTGTGPGKKIHACVRKGVTEALKRAAEPAPRNRQAFFIMSRFGGGHWAEWVPEGCPYYPCHMPGQRCDFCYCPFYPCKDEVLGQWVEGSQGGQIWNCSTCTLLHEPAIADYLIQNPEASLDELKRKRDCSRKEEEMRRPL